MPVKPTYPGVYVEEIPSGVRTITGVATSIAAFIGTFRKGPLNEAMQIFSMADFEREYGGLERTSEASYAIQQFFLNGGSEAWVVRVENDDIAGGNDAVAANETLTTVHGGAVDVFQARTGRRLRGGIALDPGTWGDNLRLDVDYATSAPGSLFNLTVSEVRIDGERTTVLQTEIFRNLTMNLDTPNNAIEVVNQGSRLIQIDRDGMAALAADTRPAATGTVSGLTLGGLPAPVPLQADIEDLDVTLTLTNPAGNTGALTLPFDFGPANPVPTTHVAWAQAFQRALRATAELPGVAEEHRPYLAGATVDLIGDGTGDNPHRFVVNTGRGARPFDTTAELSFSGGDVANYRLDNPSGVSVGPQQISLADGHDGTVFNAALAFVVPMSVFQGIRNNKTGIFALEDVDIFNILCIPQAALLGDNDMRALYTAAQLYAEERRSMSVVDIPTDVQRLDHMQTWIAENAGLRHANSAVYFPRTNIPDPLNRNRPTSLAASGTIAGLWARTDTQRGVWKAPAGTDARLRNVQSLGYNLTDDENGALNPLGVNCLRNFPVYSNICWGARTLEGADVLASDWKYIPVRRTTLFIEESLFRGTKWVVFEPNDEPLWAQIRMNVGAFMQDLFRKGAFQGTTPREAYFVKCDGETTTQQDIDNGIVNIEVGFAPLKPAEFVILKIQQIVRRTEA